MSNLSQDQVEKAVLDHLFDRANSVGGKISSADIAHDLQLPEPRVAMALRSLDGRQLLRAAHNYLTGSTYEISENGYRQVEAEQRPPQGVTEISGGRTYLVEGETPADFGQPGDVFMEMAPLQDIEGGEIGVLEAALAPASDREVRFDDNAPELNEAIEKLESALPAIESLNEPKDVDIAVHARTGIEFLKRCRDRLVSTTIRLIQLLVVKPFKKAIESSLEDSWKLAIQAGLLLLLTYLASAAGLL